MANKALIDIVMHVASIHAFFDCKVLPLTPNLLYTNNKHDWICEKGSYARIQFFNFKEI